MKINLMRLNEVFENLRAQSQWSVYQEFVDDCKKEISQIFADELESIINEAFNKAEKYEEIKHLVDERTDLNAYALIERIIDIIDKEDNNAT